MIFLWMDRPHFIYPPFCSWAFRLFLLFGHLLWVMLLWTFVYEFLCGYMFSLLLGRYLGLELLGHIVTLCLIFWGTAKLFFQSGCTILHSYRQSMRVSVSPCQHLFSSVILIIAIVVDVKWCLCGFDWHFPNNWWRWTSFHVLFAICILSLKKCLFKSFAHFYIGLFVFYCILRILYIFWILVPYQIYDL